MSVLEQIVADKRAEVERTRRRLPPRILASLIDDMPEPRDFVGALRTDDRSDLYPPHVIAEVKRASPSKGLLRPNAPPTSWRPEALACAYERGGARCLSVLTDGPYFWGSADHLVACRAATTLPVLRKDFIVDPYQIDESRWLGADCVLLMASLLDPLALATCAARALELGLAVLFESHDSEQLRQVLALDLPPERILIGINHRDLDTLELDMDLAVRLAASIPNDRIVVAESGMNSATCLRRLMDAGIETFLIGGHLAAADDPEGALRALRAVSLTGE